MFALPSESEIGQRVSIRLFEPGGGFRDLLGELVKVNAVLKKSGEIVEFDPKLIFLWKVVPR
jgi:hypothetical protein